jgi:DNA-binding transcriptional MerR regulator
MEYRVEQLAALAGVTVDTLRFYQGRGLLPAPRREGRVALYGEAHLARLRRIRELLAERFTLSQIGRLLEAEAAAAVRVPAEAQAPGRSLASREPLLAALLEESVGERTFSRAELAAASGVPDAVIVAAQAAGLFEPIRAGGQERFSAADLEMARAGLALLGAGFPIDELLELAVRHARGIASSAEAAIELFDATVIENAGDDGAAADAIAEAFRELLPQVTRLVALHFQRTLVNRALERLRAKGDSDALEKALAATESVRLEVSWQR